MSSTTIPTKRVGIVVENNALSELVPPRVQQDASLAFDLSGKGVTNDEIIKAVDNHISARQ